MHNIILMSVQDCASHPNINNTGFQAYSNCSSVIITTSVTLDVPLLIVEATVMENVVVTKRLEGTP